MRSFCVNRNRNTCTIPVSVNKPARGWFVDRNRFTFDGLHARHDKPHVGREFVSCAFFLVSNISVDCKHGRAGRDGHTRRIWETGLEDVARNFGESRLPECEKAGWKLCANNWKSLARAYRKTKTVDHYFKKTSFPSLPRLINVLTVENVCSVH